MNINESVLTTRARLSVLRGARAKTTLLAAALALWIIGAQAAQVYTQPPSGSGLMQSAWWSPNGSGYDKYVWDNFTVASSAPVTEVKWRGGYVYGGSVSGFTISFYPSIVGGSQPVVGAPLVTYTVTGNASETLAGTKFFRLHHP